MELRRPDTSSPTDLELPDGAAPSGWAELASPYWGRQVGRPPPRHRRAVRVRRPSPPCGSLWSDPTSGGPDLPYTGSFAAAARLLGWRRDGVLSSPPTPVTHAVMPQQDPSCRLGAPRPCRPCWRPAWLPDPAQDSVAVAVLSSTDGGHRRSYALLLVNLQGFK